MHLISIIIPVYNTEKYLSKCLDSIIAQTYTKWEAILINDGSTDKSGSICDEYANKDSRFKVLHQSNQGVVVARNTALSIAAGQYIAFVDSDDYIDSVMLEKMLELAEKEQFDIVWCNLKEIHKEYVAEHYIQLEEDNEKNIRKLLLSNIPGYLCNKLIKKRFWDNCNIETDSKATMCEDTYISLQMLTHNPRMGILKDPFYNYVKYNENAATATSDLPIIVKAEKSIINIYTFLLKNALLDNYIDEFTNLALKLKIGLLPFNFEKARSIFPFAHKKIKNFTFEFPVSFYYWLGFNTGILGKLLFKIKFR